MQLMKFDPNFEENEAISRLKFDCQREV